MAYFEDLTPYSYQSQQVRAETLNVGWLDLGHDFLRVQANQAFLDRLWEYCKIPLVVMRGFHVCPFCKMPHGVVPVVSYHNESLKLGFAEIRVFGTMGRTYAAPNLIFHYVRDHEYKPPQEFVDAVLGSAGPGTEDYLNKLRKLYPDIEKHLALWGGKLAAKLTTLRI